MNPVALVKNAVRSTRICPTWNDRFNYLGWLYSKNLNHGKSTTRQRGISFCYTTTIRNIDVIVRDNGGSDAFIFGEVFSHRYYDFASPSTPETILDLGANAGFTSIFFARKYPLAQIACVEPMPGNVELLRKNLELNRVNADVFPFAITVEDCSLQMELADQDYGHKVAGMDYGITLSGRTIKVEGISVPSLLKKLEWDRIGLLKVDIEGYEGILLKEKCEWLSTVDAMCIECHENYGEADLKELSKWFGFSPPMKLPGTWLLVRHELNA